MVTKSRRSTKIRAFCSVSIMWKMAIEPNCLLALDQSAWQKTRSRKRLASFKGVKRRIWDSTSIPENLVLYRMIMQHHPRDQGCFELRSGNVPDEKLQWFSSRTYLTRKAWNFASGIFPEAVIGRMKCNLIDIYPAREACQSLEWNQRCSWMIISATKKSLG